MREMIETYYRILKHDPAGKLVKDTGLIQSHSYMIQFLILVESLFDGIFKSATDVDNAASTICPDGMVSNVGNTDAPAGDDTHGVVVGTNDGATAEDNENYKLDTKILHSAIGDAGKLNYQATTLVDARVVGANIDLDLSRAYLNETGVTITVKEIGIICKNVSGVKYHLLLRDVVADEDVLDGYTLTVVYTLRTTV